MDEILEALDETLLEDLVLAVEVHDQVLVDHVVELVEELVEVVVVEVALSFQVLGLELWVLLLLLLLEHLLELGVVKVVAGEVVVLEELGALVQLLVEEL